MRPPAVFTSSSDTVMMSSSPSQLLAGASVSTFTVTRDSGSKSTYAQGCTARPRPCHTFENSWLLGLLGLMKQVELVLCYRCKGSARRQTG